MRKLSLILLFVISSTSYTIQATAGCEHDNDCKGTRICENGMCVYPPEERTADTSAAAPPVAAETAPVDNPAAVSPTEVAPMNAAAPAPDTDSEPAPVVTDSPAAAVPPVVAVPPEETATTAAPAPAPTPQPITPAPEPATPSPTADQPAAPAAVSPPATPPPTPKGPQHFKLIYGEVDGVIAFGAAGKMFFFVEDDSDSESMSGPPGGGFRLAVYGAKGSPHNGVYFTGRWNELKLGSNADSTRSISFGYTMKKVSTKKGARVRPGFGVDVGLIRTQNSDMANSSIDFENDTYTGMELFPRFALDIIAINAGGFKMVVPLSVGIYIVPFSFMKLMDDPFVLTMFTIVQPAMTIGISFGS